MKRKYNIIHSVSEINYIFVISTRNAITIDNAIELGIQPGTIPAILLPDAFEFQFV